MPKVLVADDSGVMRKIIIQALQKVDIVANDIVEVGDGEDAVEAIQKANFDLVLMDWNMPGMLGIEAVEIVRKAGKNVPIIMVTTEGEKHNVVRAIQAGANNYVIKPFEPVDLISKIEQYIPRQG